MLIPFYPTISRAQREAPDHGEHFVPGAEQAPSNQAPEALDHFKRGYHERANLREREMGELAQDHYAGSRDGRPHGRYQPFQAAPFADILCRPGCNVMYELDRARDSAAAQFATGKPITAILSQLARRRKVGLANAVWDWMDSAGIEKNVYHYNTMISVCEKVKDHRRAMQLFKEMERGNIQRNEVTYVHNMVIVLNVGRLLSQTGPSLTFFFFSYSSAISACEKAGQWRDALDLLEQMKAEGLGQTAIAYNAAISACEKGLVPNKAVQVFDQMKEEGITPTVVTYSALISAAEKGAQWKLALSVLEEMKAAGHGANVIGK